MALSAQVGRIYERLSLAAVARTRADELEHEILERQQAESTVRYERDRAQRYLDIAQVILLSSGPRRANHADQPQGLRAAGMDRARIARARLPRDLPAGADPDGTQDEVPRRARRRLRRHRDPVLTRSGEELLIEWRNTLLRDDDGDVVGTFSSGTDITERNRAVEALRTAEERMRFALAERQRRNLGPGLRHRDAPLVRDHREPNTACSPARLPAPSRRSSSAFIPTIGRSVLETFAKRGEIRRRFLLRPPIDAGRTARCGG